MTGYGITTEASMLRAYQRSIYWLAQEYGVDVTIEDPLVIARMVHEEFEHRALQTFKQAYRAGQEAERKRQEAQP
jgi:hypothetical protein